MSLELARALAATLPPGGPGLFNPYRDRCELDDPRSPEGGPEGRLQRLAAHLSRPARLVLCGEAPGFQGCRYSGVAFVSERQLIDGVIPGIDRLSGRLTTRDRSFAEPSATIVWKALFRLGIADQALAWNALQMHPYRPGSPWTNRTPTAAELDHGRAALLLLREAFPAMMFVAVGRKSTALLAAAGIEAAATIRHPANGGAVDFNNGLAELMRR